jgi:SAM-dependent methyltransferase
MMPLAGDFTHDCDNVKLYPLKLCKCMDCDLLQTTTIVDPDVLFEDYRYLSSIGLSGHFEKYANWMKTRFNLSKYSEVLEIGSNDGVLLKPLGELGVRSVGVDPSKNVSQVAIDSGCEVVVDYFSEETAKKNFKARSVDVVVANNCFAHIPDIDTVMRGVDHVLKHAGHFVVEVHYSKYLIEDGQFDTVYHEHLFYWSVKSLQSFFLLHGFEINEVSEIPIHGGSIRVVASRIRQNEVTPSVQKMLDEENESKINYSAYIKDAFIEKTNDNISNYRDLTELLYENGDMIIGYGAAGRSVIALNMYGNDAVDCVIDESPERQGRYIPGVCIPVVKPKDSLFENADWIVIYAWNYAYKIIEKIQKTNFKGKYIIPFPTVRVVDNQYQLNNEKQMI